MSSWTVHGQLWTDAAGHLAWLREHALSLLEFYSASVDPAGGFHDLDQVRRPLPTGWPPAAQTQASLFQSTRMVHSYGVAHLWGRPGSGDIVDHGMEYLWNTQRDRRHGGYFWTNGTEGPLDPSKQAYGHAFVLLAASTAKLAGHPDADRLLTDISQVIDERFWEPSPGAMIEEFGRDWSESPGYRGANSNMHSVEALLAAAEATNDSTYLARALSIAELLIAEATAGNEWRVPEHFHADWTIDKQYDRDVFRPYGSTIGHWLEWSRLLLQLWVATDKVHAWLPEAAATLFAKAMDEGWDKSRGGFYFTVDWEGRPVDTDRYWWPCTEGIAAAYWLGQHLGTDDYEQAYRLIWSWSAKHLIDPGGHFWRHQLNDALEEISNPWYGCPDLYHAIQATLIPTVPAQSSLAAALAHGARR